MNINVARDALKMLYDLQIYPIIIVKDKCDYEELIIHYKINGKYTQFRFVDDNFVVSDNNYMQLEDPSNKNSRQYFYKSIKFMSIISTFNKISNGGTIYAKKCFRRVN